MSGHKIQRAAEDIRRELTDIFRTLKDPRVQGALLSIVRVELSNDYSYCKVHISAMEGLDRAKTAAQGLSSAAGFIRSELARRLPLRHVPKLSFTPTDSIEYSAEISKRLAELRSDDQ